MQAVMVKINKVRKGRKVSEPPKCPKPLSLSPIL